MLRTICFAGLALLIGVTHMKHFIIHTKDGLNITYIFQVTLAYKNLGKSGSDYDDVPMISTCQTQVSFECGTSSYTCPKGYPDPCKMPMEKCKCKECQECLDVNCLKKKFGCKLSTGKPGKLCSMVAFWEVCQNWK